MPYAYYRRLRPWQQHIYRRSDEIVAIPVPAADEFTHVALGIGQALASGDPQVTTRASHELLRRICARLGVAAPGVTVLAERPAGHWGELHGLYNPGDAGGRITVWMRTARRGQIVAFRTFLRTLLHELCHHLDYALLRLEYSFHTAGFYKRESSLYRQLMPQLPPTRRRAPSRPSASPPGDPAVDPGIDTPQQHLV
jgi:hypothetical protein